ncbi:MAG: sarcosine oxidase subunit gamma [Roseivivax sp.]|nr:sarcosine oxidase subunit gamma [Roseivivax sp.]
MVELTASAPFDAGMERTIGAVTLRAAETGPVTALMPYAGQERALSAALERAHGLEFPAAGRMTSAGQARCLWSGLDQAMLIGVEPDPALADHAAVVAQSDGWAALTLTGDAVADVLARLVPVDLRPAAFEQGASIRSELGHMMVILARTGPQQVTVMGFRSMAGTLLHELENAMTALAARPKG